MDNCEFITEDEWSHITEEYRRKIAEAVAKDRVKESNLCAVKVPNTFYAKYGKRILDIVFGGFACIAFLLVNVIIAIITYFDVGSPIIFRQERIGKDGKLFTLIKFRSMTNKTNSDGILLSPKDRITRWGRFVRMTSLDELLNFWSILKGDMSIIGPRPLPTVYYSRFSDYHQQRHLVRPGLECPVYNRSPEKSGWLERLDNDVWYVENLSFKTDIILVFLLVKKVFSKDERSESVSGNTGEFIGYNSDGSVMDEKIIPRRYLSVVNNIEIQ